MALTPLQRQNQQRTERTRGWIIRILYSARPDPLEMQVLSDTLDGYNLAASRRALAIEVEYLRSIRLLRIFPLGCADELTNVEQAKLIQRYANSDNDQEMNVVLCVSLTAHGINFQEGLEQIEGVYWMR